MKYKYIKQNKMLYYMFSIYISRVKKYLKGVKNIEQKLSHMLHDSREIDDMTLSFSLFFIIIKEKL